MGSSATTTGKLVFVNNVASGNPQLSWSIEPRSFGNNNAEGEAFAASALPALVFKADVDAAGTTMKRQMTIVAGSGPQGDDGSQQGIFVTNAVSACSQGWGCVDGMGRGVQRGA